MADSIQSSDLTLRRALEANGQRFTEQRGLLDAKAGREAEALGTLRLRHPCE